MCQQTFTEGSFERYSSLTRLEYFLSEMERIIPWRELYEIIEPF